MKKKYKYIHDENFHKLKAPTFVVPIVLKLFPNIHSVVDFGCGLGAWLSAFKNNGVEEILGLDGDWYDKILLFKHITESEFKIADFETPIHLEKKYDLVLSLEVAEHISEQSADIFVQSLVDAGNIILFSAAIPCQGGYNHINEQFPSYWVNKFRKHGYKSYDIIRPKIWNISNIETWYKQNIFLVVHKSLAIDFEETDILPLVHPDVLQPISKIMQGKRGVSFYLRLLFMSIINKFKNPKI